MFSNLLQPGTCAPLETDSQELELASVAPAGRCRFNLETTVHTRGLLAKEPDSGGRTNHQNI